MANDGVADLVICHHLLLVGLEDAALLLKASDHALDRLVEVTLFNGGSHGAGG